MSAQDVADLKKYMDDKFAAVDADLERIKKGIGNTDDFPSLLYRGTPDGKHQHHLTAIDETVNEILAALADFQLSDAAIALIVAELRSSTSPTFTMSGTITPDAPAGP